jgi:disulfide bond formation protein DsbB
MRTARKHRLFVVWLILSGLALLYLGIDHSAHHRGANTASTIVTVSAIVIAMLKVHLILREFMEVREAPRLLRSIMAVWVVLMAGVLLTVYFVGKALA